MKQTLAFLVVTAALEVSVGQARVITVNTALNENPPVGQTSLLQALTDLQDNDEIRFAIAGAGPHFIATPPEGYPLVTKTNVLIDGYTQPGAAPNTNPILAANNAQIRIVLDSRNGNSRLMDFAGDGPNDDTGYGDTESAVIGVLAARGFVLRGVSILGTPTTGIDGAVSMYGVSFAKGASGRVSGCWIGVAPDGVTVAGPANGVTGFRYRVRNESNEVLETILVNDVVVGVPKNSPNAPADFNLLTGLPAIPIILEGQGSRIAGNFLGVLPDGKTDVNFSLDPAFAGVFEGFIEIGRSGNNTVIGTDGDGVNDANERNVIGGALPPRFGGYDHSIEFYSQSPGTNIVIAGNYIGVAIDGLKRFTNGVPALNASGATAVYRFGSNFDGVSDDLEGNVVFNLWPDTLFTPDDLANLPAGGLGFFDELDVNGTVSARGNTLVNNFPVPVSPVRDDGAFMTNYYAKALVSTSNGLLPTLSPNSTGQRLIGTVPVADTNKFPVTIVDVYEADPEGLATGKALGVPEFPNGFIQGRIYRGSYVDNGPQDANPAAGEFNFSLAWLPVGSVTVTITANYAIGPEGPAGAAVLTSPFALPITITGGDPSQPEITRFEKTAQGLLLEWTGGGLQQSDRVTEGWQDIPAATSPITVPTSQARQFFRPRR